MPCFYDILFNVCIHMAGPTRLQSGLKIRLQSMLENMQQFHFAANNIPENPASRACLDRFVKRGGGFPEVVHYYRGQWAFSPKINHFNESFQKTSIPPPWRELEVNRSTAFGCPNTLTIITNNFFSCPDGRNFLRAGSVDNFWNDPI